MPTIDTNTIPGDDARLQSQMIMNMMLTEYAPLLVVRLGNVWSHLMWI